MFAARLHHTAPLGRLFGFRPTTLGLALGIAGMVGQRYARRAASTAGKDWDEVLKDEHRALEDLFVRLENARPAMRSLVVAQIRRALVRHGLAEENAVYPTMAEALGEADALAMYAQHAEIKLGLAALVASDGEPAEDRETSLIEHARELRRTIARHVEEEEALLDRLREVLSDEENRKLDGQVRREGLWLA